MKQFGSYMLNREGEHMDSNNASAAAAGPVSVPVGFRFHPTEEELVNHYLRNKLQGMDSHIPEIDVCKYEPSDIPALLGAETETETRALEWFFICPRDYKYTNSTRSNRTTQKGFWKITGKERLIKTRRSKVVIGKKRTLTFYEGRASRSPKPKKTNWVLHEYYLIDTETKQAKMDFVICRLKNNSDKKETSICPEGEPGSPIVSNCESQGAGDMTPEPQENGESLFHPLQPQEYSSSTLQSPLIELGDVLQANGNSDGCNELQSPFGDNGSSLTDRNDISTCDEGEAPSSYTVFDFENQVANNMMMEQSPIYTNLGDVLHANACNDEYNKWKSLLGDDDSSVTFDFENQAPDDMLLEPFAQPENNLDSLLHPTQPHQSQMYCSTTLQSPIYTNLGDVPLANVCEDECSIWQFQFANCDSYLTNKNSISTNDENEPVSNTALIFENQATNYRISKVFPQPEENLESSFQPLQPQDYTL